MTQPQDVCSLPQEAREARRTALSHGLLSKVRERQSLSDGLVLRFEGTPDSRAEVEAFIEFEQACCPTLGLSLRESGSELELEIRGLDPDSDLFAGIGPKAEAPARSANRWRRALSSVGLGTVAALSLCCILPMAGVALFSAALAAPLTRLDTPWAISSTALVLAAALWFWQRRRSANRRYSPAGASACSSDGGCGC